MPVHDGDYERRVQVFPEDPALYSLFKDVFEFLIKYEAYCTFQRAVFQRVMLLQVGKEKGTYLLAEMNIRFHEAHQLLKLTRTAGGCCRNRLFIVFRNQPGNVLYQLMAGVKKTV